MGHPNPTDMRAKLCVYHYEPYRPYPKISPPPKNPPPSFSEDFPVFGVLAKNTENSPPNFGFKEKNTTKKCCCAIAQPAISGQCRSRTCDLQVESLPYYPLRHCP